MIMIWIFFNLRYLNIKCEIIALITYAAINSTYVKKQLTHLFIILAVSCLNCTVFKFFIEKKITYSFVGCIISYLLILYLLSISCALKTYT